MDKYMKNKIFIIIIIILVVIMEYFLILMTYKPKIVNKSKTITKIKIEKKIKEIDFNKYYIYEDRYQVVSLILYDNKYVSFDSVIKDYMMPNAGLFNSHEGAILYSVEEYKSKFYIKDSYGFVQEVTKLADGLLFDDYKFEPTNLTHIYEVFNKFFKSSYD